ncbi:hypothetical protein SO802_005056 [Lithocarpus litseifolius]|uniref:PGG domain-containing protein n=1 Tax=Lithocarpus litseifolius TaxID=425828 RepID=A0AAW2DH33_9ROSI
MNDGGDDIVDLYNASASGCTTTLKNLINKDPHILHKISLTPFSETPLHISALLGHLDFTKTLLAQNPRLASELDYHERSPLHLASAEGHIEIVQAQLHAFEDACLILDQDGNIPLHYAAMRGRVDVMKKLIVVRPDSTQVVLRGKETLLHLCVKYNQLEPLKLLVESTSENGHFLNSKNSEGGNTILHLAVTLKQIETVKFLLSVDKVKEEVNSLNKKDSTALKMLEDYPKDFNSFAIRNMLLDASARVEKVNNASESIEITQSRNKWWRKWWKHLKYQGDWATENRGSIMIVATMITTLTCQQTANPPGDIWQQGGYVLMSEKDNYTVFAGTSVVGSYDVGSYVVFMVFNAISFIASVIVTFLLISGFPTKNKFCMGLLTIALCTTLAFLVITYLVAIYMVISSSEYFNYKVYELTQKGVLGSLAAVIVLVFLIRLIRILVWVGRKIKKPIPT